jgi:hypothetical protein
MTRTTSIKNFIGFGILIGLFVFIFAYSIFQTRSLTKGVDLIVEGIKDGQIFEGNILSLYGKAVHAKHISINDKEILIDTEENFKEEVVLSPGYNIITIEAKDKFDKKTNLTYRVFYKQTPSKETALSNN